MKSLWPKNEGIVVVPLLCRSKGSPNDQAQAPRLQTGVSDFRLPDFVWVIARSHRRFSPVPRTVSEFDTSALGRLPLLSNRPSGNRFGNGIRGKRNLAGGVPHQDRDLSDFDGALRRDLR